ncbi:MAG: oxygenase MpaB family protein [Pigmentiphaga sp.]|nr:oxygenase MpaB family protein [Pigmentiphaga sp.]
MVELLRQRIEKQVLSLTGLALGEVDFEHPDGAPALFSPDSASWRIHRDFSSMLVGGVSALLMQMLHPSALAGVWDHSNFRADMLGRLRRTGQFIAATTYAPRADAQRQIEKVIRIHQRVQGHLPSGEPYSANDPALLTWVHVAEVSSFLNAHLRFLDPNVPDAVQDAYFEEYAYVAEALGARNVPKSRAAVAQYLQTMRPALRVTERSREVARFLFEHPPASSRWAAPIGRCFLHAGVGLLPDWAQQQFGWTDPRPAQRGAAVVHRLAPVLRWAVRNGSFHRARRRMGLDPLVRLDDYPRTG